MFMSETHIKDKRRPIIGTILARGGSKGVPGKNIKRLCDKPLIHYTIQHAVDANIFDVIVVSSDSPEILAAASEIPSVHLIERPHALATDTAGKKTAQHHAVRTMEERLGIQFEIVVDLDPTCPLRLPLDIIEAVNLLTPQVQNVISGTLSDCSPYFSMVEKNSSGFVNLSKSLPEAVKRRQDAPHCYDMSGSVYVWWRDDFFSHETNFLHKTVLLELPVERCWDIDQPLDWMVVEMLMQRRLSELNGI
jgi:CMP-N,N'-diacetyllegionaminic acid synthase